MRGRGRKEKERQLHGLHALFVEYDGSWLHSGSLVSFQMSSPSSDK